VKHKTSKWLQKLEKWKEEHMDHLTKERAERESPTPSKSKKSNKSKTKEKEHEKNHVEEDQDDKLSKDSDKYSVEEDLVELEEEKKSHSKRSSLNTTTSSTSDRLHQWENKHISNKPLCVVCAQKIHGPMINGSQCNVCSEVAHKKCAKMTPSNCPGPLEEQNLAQHSQFNWKKISLQEKEEESND